MVLQMEDLLPSSLLLLVGLTFSSSGLFIGCQCSPSISSCFSLREVMRGRHRVIGGVEIFSSPHFRSDVSFQLALSWAHRLTRV